MMDTFQKWCAKGGHSPIMVKKDRASGLYWCPYCGYENWYNKKRDIRASEKRLAAANEEKGI